MMTEKPEDERRVDQQSSTAASPSSNEIVMVIKELHVCYDYCAAWKEPIPEVNQADREEGPIDVSEAKQ